ncbi:MAG: hypothetical protein R3Y27_06835 [Clostridia bacterium]
MVNYKKIAQAIVLYFIGSNLFQVNIILTIIGVVLLYKSIEILRDYDKTTSLLKPLLISLVVVEVISSLISLVISALSMFFNISIEQLLSVQTIFLTITQVISSLILIYLYYQFLTIIANLCAHLDKPLSKKMKLCRNLTITYSVIASIQTIITLTMYVSGAVLSFIAFEGVWTILLLILRLSILIFETVLIVKAYKLFNNYVPVMPEGMQAQMPIEMPIETE